MKVLQVCAYAADYEGNFINSLYEIERKLAEKGDSVIYAFPENAREKEWCIDLCKRTKVYFLPLKWARIKPKTYLIIRKIVKNESVDIIHSHFELYDIPCAKSARNNVKVFWHLHDPITKSNKASRNLLNKLQYSVFSKKVYLISVCDYYKDYIISLGFNSQNACTITNGIDRNRISYPYSDSVIEYDFLTFGWDFYRKGSDLILSSLDKLYKEGFSFRLLFNCNETTECYLNDFFENSIPEWLVIGKPVKNINTIFSKTNIFIQASRKETFSYAVCEAAYAGLDVICSDIPGLEWAHSIPTVSFFEKENEDELYNQIRSRLEDKKCLSNKEIKTARDIIESEFTKEIWADKIIEKYKSCN